MVRKSGAVWLVVCACGITACGGQASTGRGGTPDRGGSSGEGGSSAGGGPSASGGSSAGGVTSGDGGASIGGTAPGSGGVFAGGGSAGCLVTTDFCNGVDDDCDGLVDEPESSPGAGDGVDFTAIEHCGTCNLNCTFDVTGAVGVKCVPPATLNGLVPGTCDYLRCSVGHFDLDGNRANGCEYFCARGSSPAPEEGGLCGVDDDCNGVVDDLDLCTEDDCGLCGRPCTGPHQNHVCSYVIGPGATCRPETAQCGGDCVAGWADGDDDLSDGCEVRAGSPPSTGPEVCDGWDNDGDGIVDENGIAPDGIDGTASPDDPSVHMGDACGSNVGACKRGVIGCIGGEAICIGAGTPGPELCDGLDDDCNGEVDEGSLCDPGFCANVSGAFRCVDACATSADCPPHYDCVTDLRVSTRPDLVTLRNGCLERHDPR
ncbi:MAG TPA: MopE-related protein [Polyangiaceae bacterium]|nr:MopE-related protein [Polyangiaceae bacterium]